MAVFRVEKTKNYVVMAKFHLKDTGLSLKSKGLLSMMLSLPDDWNYTTRGLAAICKEGVDSIGAALKELEKAGYMARNKLRDEKGRIYDTEYIIYEQPQKQNEPKHEVWNKQDTAKPDTATPDTENPYTDKPCTENPAQLSNELLSTKEPNNIILNINQSIRENNAQGETKGKIDVIDKIEAYRQLIKENVEYDIMCQRYRRSRLDEIVELIVETVFSSNKYVRVAGNDMPVEIVKSRLLKIDSSHIEYVFECIDKNTTKVNNVKGYLLTTLYNATVTIDTYYRAEVNHDMYGRD